jgi:mRNA-degrading endonuclease RelE of RelBE toxin-antitoxin system
MDNNTTEMEEKLLKNLSKIDKNQQTIKSKLKEREEMILPIINTHKFLKNPGKLPQLLNLRSDQEKSQNVSIKNE